MVSLEGLVDIWATFLERLGAQKMSLAAYLADARPTLIEGGTVTVGVPGSALHQEVLNDVDNRRFIQQLLSDLCQTKVTIQFAALPELKDTQGPPGAPRPPAEQEQTPGIVQDIVTLFNATVVDKPRPT